MEARHLLAAINDRVSFIVSLVDIVLNGSIRQPVVDVRKRFLPKNVIAIPDRLFKVEGWIFQNFVFEFPVKH